MRRIEGSPVGGVGESIEKGKYIKGVPVLKAPNIALVREAREKGFIDKLPSGIQEVLEQRYPQEGRPITLLDIGSDMQITKERVRQKEASALRRIKRLLEGKRQTEGEPRGDIDVNEVIRLYIEEKKTMIEIANLMDCSFSTISNRLKAAGVPTRSRGRIRVETDINLLVWQYFVQEMSSREIARPSGISHKTVLNRLEEEGYQMRRRTRRPRKK